jgi:hypothetical protein
MTESKNGSVDWGSNINLAFDRLTMFSPAFHVRFHLRLPACAFTRLHLHVHLRVHLLVTHPVSTVFIPSHIDVFVSGKFSSAANARKCVKTARTCINMKMNVLLSSLVD